MGYKNKWKGKADENLLKHLEKVSEIISPLFKNNGMVDLLNLDKKNDLGYVLALILNSKLAYRGFGADDIVALHLEVENNKFLKYWGKINWLAKPSNHECHKSYQDPFYGLFKLENNHIDFVEGMFGDYDKSDLDSKFWIYSEMNWIYEL